MTRPAWCSSLLFAGAVACGDDGTGPTPTVDSLLVVDPVAISLTVGASQPLTAILVVSDTDTVAVTPQWTSRDGAVASVSDSGVVTAIGAGTTHIVAVVGSVADSTAVEVTGGTIPVAPSLRLITDALTAPVFALSPPADPTRLFVVEQGGTVRVLRNDTLLAAPFLDIGGLVSDGNEQGLLSMAFHPAYETNGYVFVSYTDALGVSKVVRYTVSDPETADPASAFEVLSVPQPYTNHNGGLVTFGPDGMLYVGLGDGGGGRGSR